MRNYWIETLRIRKEKRLEKVIKLMKETPKKTFIKADLFKRLGMGNKDAVIVFNILKERGLIEEVKAFYDLANGTRHKIKGYRLKGIA